MKIYEAFNASYGNDTSGFRSRVEYLIVKSAVAVIAESAGTTNHAARLLLAQNILQCPQSHVTQFALGAMVNPTLLAALTPRSIIDADLEFAINAVFDAMTVPVVVAGSAVAMVPAVVTGTLTRPANVTAYTIGDELTDVGGLVLAIPGCARAAGGAGILDSVTVIDNANAATDPTLDIFVMDATSAPAADNLVFAPTDVALQATILASGLGTAIAGDSTVTGNLVWQLRGLNIPYVCGPGSTSLFVRFAVRSAYVPTAGETLAVRLGIRL